MVSRYDVQKPVAERTGKNGGVRERLLLHIRVNPRRVFGDQGCIDVPNGDLP